MPLLDDAKNCFVGQTQIKQIYAGTDKVWPKEPALQLVNVGFSNAFPNTRYYCMVIEDDKKYTNCSEIKAVYSFRLKTSTGNWSPFYPFVGFTTSEDNVLYLFIDKVPSAQYQDSFFQLRKESVSSDVITLDLLKSPDIGLKTMVLDCN